MNSVKYSLNDGKANGTESFDLVSINGSIGVTSASVDPKTSPSVEKTVNTNSESNLEASPSASENINSDKPRIMGSEEDPRDYDISRKHFRIGFIIASVSGILMWLFMFIFVFQYNGGLSWGTNENTEINLHIVLMTFFVIYLQGHGALLFRLFPSRPKFQVKLMHAGIHLSTILGMALAFWSALRSHSMKKSPNFYTIHSWIGLTAIILYYGQFLIGFSVFLLPWAPMRLRTLIVPYHKMIGPLIFICSTMAAFTGIMMKALGAISTRYQNLPADAMVINFAGIFLLIFAMTVVTLVYEHRFRRRARPEGEMLLAESDRSQ